MAGDQIRYRRTGGFAGTTLSSEVDIADLPPQLRSLVDHADLGAVAARSAPTGADRFQHELVVERGGQEQRAVLGDHEVSDEVRPLVDYLQARARAG